MLYVLPLRYVVLKEVCACADSAPSRAVPATRKLPRRHKARRWVVWWAGACTDRLLGWYALRGPPGRGGHGQVPGTDNNAPLACGLWPLQNNRHTNDLPRLPCTPSPCTSWLPTTKASMSPARSVAAPCCAGWTKRVLPAPPAGPRGRA